MTNESDPFWGQTPADAPPPSTSPSPLPPPPSTGRKVARGIATATVVRVGIAVVLLGGGAVWNWINGARRDESGTISEAGALDVFKVAVGDCLDWPGDPTDSDIEIERVQGMPCGVGHDLEVYALIDYPAVKGADYPGVDFIFEWGVEECLPLFESYVGASYNDVPDLDVSVFYPTEESWNKIDDRQVVCLVNQIEGFQLYQSVKGRDA